MKEINLKIEGMHCESCEKIIKMEMDEVPGVLDSVIDSKAGTGNIKVEDSISEENILKVVANTGYKAEILKEKNV
ncbi:MAG: copper-translocating P-type ATPase, Cu2+-exporting ATPase [Candidatus Berkelbacteria bacterium]|nr:copper-translocating P-type ATPase, Cu2+-exporting ATPase [Candidatus Berkelbacteria bacterium]